MKIDSSNFKSWIITKSRIYHIRINNPKKNNVATFCNETSIYLSTSTWKKSQWIQVMVSMHQYNRNKISNLFQVCEKCHEDALEGNFVGGGMFNDTYPLAITAIHLTYDTLLCKIYKYNYK
ncbi:MAG: hypothetical protein M3044_07275 [Thermoproteota archaeon]|nr:hypothetical protein [Thermoproteota archaeon]